MANEPTMLRHFVGGLIMFTMLTGLFLGIYTQITDHYQVTDSYTGYNSSNNQNIGQVFEELLAASAYNDLAVSLNKIQDPSIGGEDKVGELLASGLGIINFVLGLILLPFQILMIVNDYYRIPTTLVIGITLMFVIYIGFIWRSAQMRGDV